MKNYTKLSYVTIVMLFFASSSYTINKYKQLANLVGQVGKQTSGLTTQILNGGDSTKTLLSLSKSITQLQNIVATNINNSQREIETNLDFLQSNMQSLITNLGTSNDLSGLYFLLASNIVSQESATPLLLNDNYGQSDLQKGQIALIQLSKRRPEIITPLTSSLPSLDVDAYNAFIVDLLQFIDNAIIAVQTNINDPSPAHLEEAQMSLFYVTFNLGVVLENLNILINDNITVTSEYSLEKINAALTLLQARISFLLSLGLQRLIHVI